MSDLHKCPGCGEWTMSDPDEHCESGRQWDATQAQEKATRQKDAVALALIYAKDIVDAWPQITIRTLGQMTKRIDTLRQALEAARK